jgi:hypothetical protein
MAVVVPNETAFRRLVARDGPVGIFTQRKAEEVRALARNNVNDRPGPRPRSHDLQRALERPNRIRSDVVEGAYALIGPPRIGHEHGQSGFFPYPYALETGFTPDGVKMHYINAPDFPYLAPALVSAGFKRVA